MAHTPPRELNALTKGFLAVLCMTVFVVPIATGISTGAQTPNREDPGTSLKLEVASIRPTRVGETSCRAHVPPPITTVRLGFSE
jgi:hypothetical protein